MNLAVSALTRSSRHARGTPGLAAVFALGVTAQPAQALADSFTEAKSATTECIKSVRQQALAPENSQFGEPAMWRNFDAFVSPDGRMHDNVQIQGQIQGEFLSANAWPRAASSSISAADARHRPPDHHRGRAPA